MKQTHWSKHSPEDLVKHVCVDSAREQTLGLRSQASTELHPQSLEKGSEPVGYYWEGPQGRSQLPPKSRRDPMTARAPTAFCPGTLFSPLRMPAYLAGCLALDQTIK